MSSNPNNIEQLRPHWIEWLTGLVSLAAICAVIGWLAVDIWTTDDRQPELVARVVSAEKVATGFQVVFELRNRATLAAAGVEVRAQLSQQARLVEEAEVTFDYVAAGSTARGAVIFENDPARLALSIRAVGFTEP
ncbi:TIGR02588 family protein [Rhizobium glycinendophyticum]|uniref:TIGR02588 family protein n=1 Tax=Rhizobium glycinendophyticum TaxID=2589807 RepID=A0A504UAC0_9HYPH|nr:TIGR02588 family protein [Rhizobium glycinendophyticum]TPP11449.1 TIGR02588 family protein [Rhizobium glycinendophyticum]